MNSFTGVLTAGNFWMKFVVLIVSGLACPCASQGQTVAESTAKWAKSIGADSYPVKGNDGREYYQIQFYYEDYNKNSIPVTDPVLTRLKDMGPQLSSLHLIGAHRLTTKGWAELSGFENLRQLGVDSYATFDDLDVERVVASAPKLEALRISGTSITDSGVRALAKLEDLEKVNLSNNDITIDGVMALRNLRFLKWVQIVNCKRISADDVAVLKAAMPDVEFATK